MTEADVGAILFGDYLRGPGAGGPESRVYEEIKDVGKATKILEDSNEEYNMTHSTPMNLVFFKDALEHVSRILRVLRQERGNLLLVGVGESGRSS
jgi:dynein heavy chain